MGVPSYDDVYRLEETRFRLHRNRNVCAAIFFGEFPVSPPYLPNRERRQTYN
jgi:hypothetical protein